MSATEISEIFAKVGPAIILIEPQLGENIGFAARGMLNFGLTDLRIVRPREDWPNPKALTASAGADDVINGAKLYDHTSAAIADLHHLYAATVRKRDMVKPVIGAREAVRKMASLGASSGVLFGPERSGLTNDDVALADTILSVPVNPGFSSLSLPHAVLLISYEWFNLHSQSRDERMPRDVQPATRSQLLKLFTHLESELEASGFLRNPEMRPRMMRNLRNALGRASLTEKEVSALRGVIRSLSRK